MKYYFCQIILLLFFNISFGQKNSVLVGNWKVFAAYNDTFYFNFKTDSNWISSSLKINLDTITQAGYINRAKEIYGNFYFYFDNKGNFSHCINLVSDIRGRYADHPTFNEVELITVEKPAGTIVIDPVTYYIKDGLLYFSFFLIHQRINLIAEKSQ